MLYQPSHDATHWERGQPTESTPPMRSEVMWSKNQGKAYFCVHCGELSEFLHSYWYSREFWKLITKCDNLQLQSATVYIFTKCENLLLQSATAILLQSATAIFLQSATAILLQSATSVITKFDRYYKVWQFYYKVRQVLQSASIITKCDRTS